MKTIRGFSSFFYLLFLIIPFTSFSQDQISSISPSAIYPGESTDIVIHGMGTSFKSGVTVVNFGPGITANRPNVFNSETMDVFVTVSKTAAIGFNSVTVTTGSDVIVKNGAIQIFQQGSSVRATILVTPVQSIHLSDFDPTNIANAPLLFTITLYNDAVVQNLEVLLTVSGQKLGQIGTATKTYKNEKANGVETLNNRQFDKYTVSSTNTPAIQAAIQTGTLPSDIYDYHVEILDANGNDIADADGSNTITNQESKPELISPGNPFFSDPVLVHTYQPIFEWFCQANSINLNVYEVYAGQISSAAVAINRPTYTINNISGTSYQYPAGASMLQDGHTYAWQIIANYATAAGPSQLSSDLFWFTVTTSLHTVGNHTLAQITVSPANITMKPGQTQKFSAQALDINNDTIAIQPAWTVVPAEGGTIDNNGNFTAGGTRSPVAVIATFGDIKDYSTIYIIKDLKENTPVKSH